MENDPSTPTTSTLNSQPILTLSCLPFSCSRQAHPETTCPPFLLALQASSFIWDGIVFLFLRINPLPYAIACFCSCPTRPGYSCLYFYSFLLMVSRLQILILLATWHLHRRTNIHSVFQVVCFICRKNVNWLWIEKTLNNNSSCAYLKQSQLEFKMGKSHQTSIWVAGHSSQLYATSP